eukprot:s395_g27.t1
MFALCSAVFFEFQTLCAESVSDSLLGILIALTWLADSWLSIFAFFDKGVFHMCDLCDGLSHGSDMFEPSSFPCRVLIEIGHSFRDFPWSLWTLLSMLLIISSLFAIRLLPKRPVHRRCIVAARRVGHRRYGLSKTLARRWLLKTKRPSMVTRWLRFHVFAKRSKLLTVVRPTSVGESACTGLTPRCRACNAGDGLVAAPEHDAWAAYLKQKTQPVVRPTKTKKYEPPPRGKWVDLAIDLAQLQGPIQQLSPDAFGTNTSGIALLTRQMLLEASSVRSGSPLAVILPGDRNDVLNAAGINESVIQETVVQWLPKRTYAEALHSFTPLNLTWD